MSTKIGILLEVALVL